eukprot:TRINITY_DN11987_c0_g1_i1.p1 TRINITY_DN11987_c0_g1~~TRINITY_DN11987_c0_g1_i1.p1  ORF type:complete len:386 (+),score=6.09 TRINITY_DN11987_c0_g1_i1:507-1664(+)
MMSRGDGQSSIEEINLKEEQSVEIFSIIKQNSSDTSCKNLPGQIVSEEDYIDTLSSSSNEFDVETFRNSQPIKSQNFVGKTKSDNINSKYLEILVFKFEIAKLQERNKNPVLFLQCIFFNALIGDFIIFVVYCVGQSYRIIPLLFSLCFIIMLFPIFVDLCQLSIKDGIKVKPRIILAIGILSIVHMFLIGYSVFVQTPFNSILLFLLGFYLNCLTQVFVTVCIVTPNPTPFDDPNYQLKFFGPRIMSAFFNGTGAMDAISDVILGIQLFQYPHKKFLIIGVVLLFLCNVDYLQVLRRLFTPYKITTGQQIFTLVIEVIVMVLTVVVLFDMQNFTQDQSNEDDLIVVVISISTTIINFVHNLLILFYQVWFKSKTQLNDDNSYIM